MDEKNDGPLTMRDVVLEAVGWISTFALFWGWAAAASSSGWDWWAVCGLFSFPLFLALIGILSLWLGRVGDMTPREYYDQLGRKRKNDDGENDHD